MLWVRIVIITFLVGFLAGMQVAKADAKILPNFSEADRADLISEFRDRGPLPGRIGMIGVPEKPEPPARVLIDAGPATNMGYMWTWADWQYFYDAHASWGHNVGPPSPDGIWCVQSQFDVVGQVLILVSGGVEIWCVTADVVQPGHKAYWNAHFSIELPWWVFETLVNPGWVEVYMPL
jgi:hypothetical protein